MTMAYWGLISRLGGVLVRWSPFVGWLQPGPKSRSTDASTLLATRSRFPSNRTPLAFAASQLSAAHSCCWFLYRYSRMREGSVWGAISALVYLMQAVYCCRLWWLLGALTPWETPRTARSLADLLLPYKRAEVLIGDLEERFPRKCHESRDCRARCWYWRQVIYSVLPVVWAGLGDSSADRQIEDSWTFASQPKYSKRAVHSSPTRLSWMFLPAAEPREGCQEPQRGGPPVPGRGRQDGNSGPDPRRRWTATRLIDSGSS